MKDMIREATLGIAEEFRNMKVGETLSFPIPRYNYNSVRSTPRTCADKLYEGWRWTTRLDLDGGRILVRRLS